MPCDISHFLTLNRIQKEFLDCRVIQYYICYTELGDKTGNETQTVKSWVLLLIIHTLNSIIYTSKNNMCNKICELQYKVMKGKMYKIKYVGSRHDVVKFCMKVLLENICWSTIEGGRVVWRWNFSG